MKTKRLSLTQLELVRRLQSDPRSVIAKGRLLRESGEDAGKVDGRGVRGLLSSGVLVAVKGIDGEPLGEYRLCNAAMNTRYLPSGRAIDGGGGAEQRPTWAKIKEIGSKQGVLIHWQLSHGNGVMYIIHKNRASSSRARRTVVLEDDNGEIISGAMHFATMQEWIDFLTPRIEASKRMFLEDSAARRRAVMARD